MLFSEMENKSLASPTELSMFPLQPWLPEILTSTLSMDIKESLMRRLNKFLPLLQEVVVYLLVAKLGGGATPCSLDSLLQNSLVTGV